MLKNIGDSFKQQMDNAKGAVETVSGKVSELKEAGIEKIKSYMEEISNGLPLFEQAGFHMDGFNIELGLPPDISITFSKTKEVSTETIRELVDQSKDNKILALILNALLTANNLQRKITFNKFIFSGVSIQVGLPPKVSLKYK